MPTLPPAARLQVLWEVDAPVAVSSPSGVLYTNRAFAELVGVPAPSLIGTTLASVARDDAAPLLSVALDEVLVGGAARTHDTWLRSPEGGAIAARHACRAIEVDGQRLAVSTFMPTGDRHRLAEALVLSEQRYRDLFDEDTDGRFVASPDWRVIDCNDVFARTLGYDDRVRLAGRSLLEMTPDGPILQKLLAVTRAGGHPGRVELKVEREDGTLIDVSLLARASSREGGDVVSLQGHVVEITERRRLEVRLQGAERMEVVGRLAGGLAHDFNNLLTVISGNSERLLDAMAPGDPLRDAVSAIDHAAARAASMTQQLLAFGRRQVFELKPVWLQTLVAEAEPLVTEIVGDHISVRMSLPSDVPQISADPRQIEHVIANLALNARESMPSGGTLTMTVDSMEVGDNAPREREWLRPGRYVRLVVADTGHGMDPVTKAHAFQPFFTTKRMGDGRGLGLATVYGIVKQSHGFVWVDSAVGEGATFTLLFPVIKPGRSDLPVRGLSLAAEVILVVEEDAGIRAFACEALRRRGYQVLEAASADAALEVFTSHPSRIHLVVSDSRAVTAEGAPLSARLQTIDPRVQSLVMLEAPDAAVGERRVLPTTPSIQKPFTLQALADRVREVLDSGEGRG